MLTHTSGIPDYFDESIMEEYADLWIDFPCYRIRKTKDLLPLFINKPMMYKAGEKFQYNNSGFVMLDLIIEEITGKPFDCYLEEKIFNPCRMKDTGYYEMDRLPPKCANSYIFDEKKKEYYTNIFSVDTKGTGAGGAFTTVIDVCTLWKNLLSGTIISKKIVDKMLSIQIDSEDGKYGYGAWIKRREERLIPYFQGCDPGVSFISSFDREKEINITVVSNMCNNVWSIESELYKILITKI